MRRREFITLLGGGAAAASTLSARAQTSIWWGGITSYFGIFTSDLGCRFRASRQSLS